MNLLYNRKFFEKLTRKIQNTMNLLLMLVPCFFLIFCDYFSCNLNTSLNYFNCAGASKPYTYFGKPVFMPPKTLHYFLNLQYGTEWDKKGRV